MLLACYIVDAGQGANRGIRGLEDGATAVGQRTCVSDVGDNMNPSFAVQPTNGAGHGDKGKAAPVENYGWRDAIVTSPNHRSSRGRDFLKP